MHVTLFSFLEICLWKAELCGSPKYSSIMHTGFIISLFSLCDFILGEPQPYIDNR